MARGLNKVMLIGNLGKDPEMKYTPQGTAVTTFSMAVSRSRKSPDGQLIDETEWFRVVAWERLAETCNEFLRKGSKVYIEGRLQTRKWTAQDGQERQMVEVVANEMLLLDSRQQGGPQGGGYGDEQRPAPARQGGGGYSNSASDDSDMDVDDIPF
ncbi:MAG TPA: single-stranded DNA-binding protein [Chloroflexia bacterium]|nr:single-stranded DNA-binding protein [Chloroflexia bacterium]